MALNQLLFDIDNELDQDDFESLKFLCWDKVKSKKLENMKSSRDLFEELQRCGEIDEDDYSLLSELLYLIGQNSLLKKLNTSRMTIEKQLQMNQNVPLFRRMLFEVSEHITKEDQRSIIFLLDIPNKYKESKNFLEILRYLEKNGVISADKLEPLEKTLCNVSKDLLRIVNDYKEKRGSLRIGTPPQPPVDELDDMSKPSFSVQDVSSTDMEMAYNDAEMSSIREYRQHVSEPASKEVLDAENHMSSLNLEEQPKIEVYAMNRKHRGYCVIVNNENFDISDTRKGTEKDAESLRDVFAWLGFDVEIHNEKSVKEIHNLLKDIQARDHTERDCLVCCFLTHGESKAIFGTDNEVISIDEILSYFSSRNCQTLAGKPKLFFIQACQGKNSQSAHTIEADAVSSLDDNTTAKTIPHSADILVGMSTVDGYYSFRHIKQGSWYIQALCSNLAKMVPRGEDILSILTKVNKDVGEKQYEKRNVTYKQMPQPAYTLRKKLVFTIPKTPFTQNFCSNRENIIQ
ncbi:caspase-8-like [Hyperolius riggenbachi]|uniref:caspase-8-like n=1 Tax=Hyperolius riggenbachi TaxID=752182 RepID=UPI0035A2CBE4